MAQQQLGDMVKDLQQGLRRRSRLIAIGIVRIVASFSKAQTPENQVKVPFEVPLDLATEPGRGIELWWDRNRSCSSKKLLPRICLAAIIVDAHCRNCNTILDLYELSHHVKHAGGDFSAAGQAFATIGNT